MSIIIELNSDEVAKIVMKQIENGDINIKELSDCRSAEVLGHICDIIRNDNLSDFEMVEEIVSILEENNIDCGGCHDF